MIAEQKFILVDRDGVINVDRPSSVVRVADFEFVPGSIEAIKLLNQKGFQVLVITNQACVGRGELAIDTLGEIHDFMRREVKAAGGEVSDIYVCTHVDGDDCDCRKPRPGLILDAMRDHGFSPASTWMIGDAERDIQAAVAAGCRPALVRSPKNPRQVDQNLPVFESLLQFAQWIDEAT